MADDPNAPATAEPAPSEPTTSEPAAEPAAAEGEEANQKANEERIAVAKVESEAATKAMFERMAP